jgi:hypothetical protein
VATVATACAPSINADETCAIDGIPPPAIGTQVSTRAGPPGMRIGAIPADEPATQTPEVSHMNE